MVQNNNKNNVHSMEYDSDYSDLSDMLNNTSGNTVMWDKFLDCLAQATESESSFMLITDLVHREKTRFLFNFNISEQQLKQYTDDLNRVDTFNYLLSNKPRQVFCNQLNPTTEESSFIDEAGFHYRLGFSIPCNSLHSLNLCINRKKPFSPKQQEHITSLLQSIIKPLENALRSELQQKIYSQILHKTQNHIDGYLIIDRNLNILFSESLSTTVIDKFHCINISNESIIFNNAHISDRLSFLIDNNTEASIHNQCETCLITLIPMSSLDNLYDWECFKEGFILTFTHDKKNNPILERLTSIHNLSKCEALCALDFMQTSSISEIAETSYRSEATIRNHIKHIMQKMEVHNQAALMKKLVTLAAL